MSHSKAFVRLQALLSEAETLHPAWIGERRLIEWRLNVEITLTRLLGEDSICLRRFRDLQWPSDKSASHAWDQTVEEARAILAAALRDVMEFEPSGDAVASAKAETFQSFVAAEMRRWPRPLRAVVLVSVLAIISAFAVWQSLPNEVKTRFLGQSNLVPTTSSSTLPASGTRSTHSTAASAVPSTLGADVADASVPTKREPPAPANTGETNTLVPATPQPVNPLDRFSGQWHTADDSVELSLHDAPGTNRREGSISISYEKLPNQPFACTAEFNAAVVEHDGKTWLQISGGRFQNPAMRDFCHMQPDGELVLNGSQPNTFDATENGDVIFSFVRKSL